LNDKNIDSQSESTWL